MKKYFKYYAALWFILLALFNAVVFTAPVKVYGRAFWTGYGLVTLAFIGQLICGAVAFRGDRKKLFLNVPLVMIGYSALIVSAAAGALFMAVPALPNWPGVVLCALILGFYAVAVVKARAAAEIVSAIGERVAERTRFIKQLTAEAACLAARARSDAAKAAAQKVYDAVRYSDPMSSAELGGVEEKIALKFRAFADAVSSGEDGAVSLADDVTALVDERNRACRLLK